MSNCKKCGKHILQPNTTYGINPNAVCNCTEPQKSEPAKPFDSTPTKPFDSTPAPQKSEASTEQLLHMIPHQVHQYCTVNCPRYKAKEILSKLLYQREAEARLNGKQELIDIAAERAKNDEVYTLQAFIEDAQEYLIRVKGE